jgi:N-formylglutamate amidohydrolase
MREGCGFCQTARTGRLHLSRSGPNWGTDMTESPPPPFFRIGPERPVSPVILSVPHAGRDYGAHLLNAARLRKELLETLEDRLVDRLIWRATALGMTAFVARAPRLEIDLNREERELDPALIAPPLPSGGFVQSARTRGGLGLIPSRLTGSGPIWRERIPRAELDRRLDTIHRPFHAAIAEALAQAKARFGDAVLIDCHSMPPRPRADSEESRPATIVFGDRHGSTISGDLLDAAMAASRAMGYRTACNAPYAGGYVVARHGRPETGVHAVQIEIDRAAYLDADLRTPGPGFEGMTRLIAGVAQAIEQRLLSGHVALAAE